MVYNNIITAVYSFLNFSDNRFTIQLLQIWKSFACLGLPCSFIKAVVQGVAYITQKIVYTGCPRRNVPDFGRVFLMLKYTDITQNTYVQSGTVTEIMAREV